MFRQLDEVCHPDAILATNTSALSITEIAAVTGRPEKVIGMHFFNPVPAMKLVEVIRGLSTSEKTTEAIMALAGSLGKSPVKVEEAPGFVVNRILIPMINEAVGILADGVAEVMLLGQNVNSYGKNLEQPMTFAELLKEIDRSTVWNGSVS